MHNFEQVRDVLQYGKSVHTDLRNFYDLLKASNDRAEVKMLLDYLSSHERRLEDTMERLEQDSQPPILETWMQYAPVMDVKKLIQSKNVRSGMSVDDIVSLAEEFDDAVEGLYREAAVECDIPRLQEVFNNLAKLQATEKDQLSRAALFEDM